MWSFLFLGNIPALLKSVAWIYSGVNIFFQLLKVVGVMAQRSNLTYVEEHGLLRVEFKSVALARY
jgi:hypothetical protein